MGGSVDVTIARIAMMLTPPLHLPVMTMLNRGAMFDLMRLPNEISTLKITHITIFNTISIGLTLLVAVVLRAANQDIGFVMSVAGATCGVAIQIGFPSLFLWTMGDKCKAV